MEGELEIAHVLYEIILQLLKTYILYRLDCALKKFALCTRVVHPRTFSQVHHKNIRSSGLRTLRRGARPNL